MWSERLQKITSFFLIFSLLFSFTVRIPFELFFASSTYATNDEFYDLVSIIVDEDTYDEVRSKLIRYSRNIQSTLENTRVVILPTPSDASVVDIASLNESLYYEGYKAHKNVNFESRLIGTVLVGKIPVPVVFQNDNSARSLLPYIDFKDKAFIYDHTSKKYLQNISQANEFQAEVWHGVISPNTGNISDDHDAIADYLDKNHDFYSGRGAFEQNSGVLDGKQTPAGEDYEPYVFYYDQFRENEALQYQKYMGYEMYLQNIEDITYNRYSKELASKIKDQVLGVQNLEVGELIQNVDPDFDISGLSTGPDVGASSDIMTRYITDNSTKRYLEIFNSSTLGDMRKHVYNAGRYNEGGSRVNVDMPPFLISVLDEVSAEVIKNVNTTLENDIVDIVTGGLARDIVIPVSSQSRPSTNINGVIPNGTSVDGLCPAEYHTFYFGSLAEDITTASQCSIYRGSVRNGGTLVESNRGYNINNTQSDTNICGLGMDYNEDTGKITQGLTGFWGGNSPVNLTQSGSSYDDFQLGTHNVRGGIRPVYDILGMKEVTVASKIPSPLDCFSQGVHIQTVREEVYSQKQGPEDTTYQCGTKFSLPLRAGDEILYYSSVPNGTSRGTTHESRFCAASNVIGTSLPEFRSVYLNGIGVKACTSQTVTLEKNSILTVVDPNINAVFGPEQEPVCPVKTYSELNYKTISSHILHTSPTDEEFGAQVQSLFTPSLPIDSDRYIDFIAANGRGGNRGYQRIDFPQLFRVIADEGSDVTLEGTSQKVQEHLNKVSDQINAVIRNSDPSGLSGAERELYDILKTGDYPEANIDLYESLVSKPLEVFESNNQSKEISYFDTLVFAVYWNNLDTISSKYKFIFQEYLGNQFVGNDYGFHLPDSKKSYEMSYFAAPGDAKNMYIKLDPEYKALHPYADILSDNLTLRSTLQAANISSVSSGSSEGTFACAPPDGVPIWEWIPAVTCWIGDMLPPTIGIGASSCGHSEIFLSSEEREVHDACQGDYNKNGVNDCLEDKLEDGYISLEADAGKYYYGTAGTLSAQVYEKDGEKAFFDNASYIEFELERIEVPQNPNEVLSDENVVPIFDTQNPDLSTPEALELTKQYISFTLSRQRAQRGGAKSYFNVLSKDANIYFKTRISTDDTDGNKVINLESPLTKVEVRGDKLFIKSSVISDGESRIDTTLRVSGEQNIFLSDASFVKLEDITPQLDTVSQASEKLWLSVSNYSEDGNTLPLNYPLELSLEHDGEQVFFARAVSRNDLTRPYPLFSAQKSGSYILKITDSLGLSSYKNIDVLPQGAKLLLPTLGTNAVETGGNLSTHLFSIVDQYNNPATGEIYSVDITLDGDGLVFDGDDSKSISYQVLDGFKAFRLLSTDKSDENTLTFTLKNPSGEEIYTVSRNIRTLNTINIELSSPIEPPRVGGESYTYALSFVDSEGELLSGLNSRAYLGINALHGTPDSPYVEIISGQAQMTFTTSSLAGEDIDIEFQFEGGNDIYKKTIDILPGDPIKVDLALSNDKIEANPESSSIVEAILKDRYDNEVFNDDTSLVNLEIAPKSQTLINSPQQSKQVVGGRTQFILNATDTPGRAYFKVFTDPSISQNTFELIGQGAFSKSELNIPTMTTGSGTLSEVGKKFFQESSSSEFISLFNTQKGLTSSDAYKELVGVLQDQLLDFWKETNTRNISGVGENSGSIETFFFWDKTDITNRAYNGMYSILSGAPYGDISQKDYLGGALLFDRDNSALAVSSLIESPYVFHDIISLGNSGAIEGINSGDITQDIGFFLDTDSEGRLIIDIFNTALDTYIGKLYYNLSSDTQIDVSIDEESGYSMGDDEKKVIQNEYGKVIFEISPDGDLIRKSGSSLRLNESYSGPGILVDLLSGDELIGNILIQGELDTNITRDTRLLENKLRTLDDTIIIHLQSNQYDTRNVVSDSKNSLLKMYYKDPFSTPDTLSDFYNTSHVGLESIQSQGGVGWQDSNTMLLDFAAGESVGEATRNFQNISHINLGDPVVSLKALTTTFRGTTDKKSFDSTLGETLIRREGLDGYRIFDYNDDGISDILTLARDGYMSLHEGDSIEGGYIEQSDLVFSVDRGRGDLVKTGDFSGDGYEDIFFVTASGDPVLYNNIQKDFRRFNLTEQIDIEASIVQVESFDMDNDDITDLVTLDDAGNIYIFYGGATTGDPIFTKQLVGTSYGISLSDTILSHGGAVYFDGIIQKDSEELPSLNQNTTKYLSDLESSLSGDEEVSAPRYVDQELVNQFLYVSVPYRSSSEDISDIGGFASKREFLRSEYSALEGLEIKKTYTDINEGYLVSGDQIYLDISLKNISDTPISDIVYLDSISQYFRFENESYTVLGSEEKILRDQSIGNYNIVLDGFTLDPGVEQTLRFELKSLPLSYGNMQVGLYEQGEIGDDPYGDIILKTDETNCGDVADIYRSTDMRSYQNGTTTPSCESADIDIGNTHPNLVDSDDDGVPDYLQSIIDNEDPEEIQRYAETALSELHTDTDGDGIPDSDDSMDQTSSAIDFMGTLEKIDEATGEISQEVDTMIEGLSCGFGGGSCIATPLNWAPLAPGNDPTLFGMPVGDGLRVGEGVPIFSALTGFPVKLPNGGCIEVPVTFPFSVDTFDGVCGGPAGAGGRFGINSPTNFVRIFATPTLTGGFGTAVCFGGPARVAGNANPQGVHPVIPGGNCIVTAQPITSCEGGEGDPSVLGYPYTGNGFNVIHANCDGGTRAPYTPASIQDAFVKDYLDYQRTGVEPDGFYDTFVRAFQEVSDNGAGNYQSSGEPLISLGGGQEGLMSTQVSFDSSALAGGNFEDVIQIQNKRVAGFPGFIMDWVENQLDEVTSSLSNLPKIFVILPDFGGIMDGSFKDYISGATEAFEQGTQKDQQERDSFNSELENLRVQRLENNCDTNYSAKCVSIDARLEVMDKADTTKEFTSGIKEVYEFLGKVPLVNIETTSIPVNIPWIETSELDRFIDDWSYTSQQWQQEIQDFTTAIPKGADCDIYVGDEQASCLAQAQVYVEASVDARKLLSSLETNIEILKSYQEFPEQVSKLVSKKEDWLYQILCNVEAIAEFTGEWIRSNGERFKAWVELYVLIKAILKSWQIFIDVFNGYEAECHECKNERQDLQNFTFSLIGSILPSAPVIQFPKWPDIILDLHNVRAGMTVTVPDLEMNMRPIVLPTLPELTLPRPNISLSANANFGVSFDIPEIPLLPEFSIPELPDIPGLPTIELPDLPPPPKIPKLFGAMEGMLNIAKLVTKVICILKNSPFVPEWRAGDQIAFLTERNGYIPTDFINLQAPAFSYSAVSAIKVSSYVNFEFEMDFISEAVRSITAPLDSISGNIVNMFDLSLGGIEVVAPPLPSNIDINIDENGVNNEVSLAPLDQNPEGIYFIASLIVKKSQELFVYLNKHSSSTLSNKEFISYVGSELSSKSITENPRTQELQNVWTQVFNFEDTVSDRLIGSLQTSNRDKFETIQDILKTEMEYSRNQAEFLKDIKGPSYITQVALSDNTTSSRLAGYNQVLEKHNSQALDAAITLLSGESPESQAMREDIAKQGEKIMQQVRGGLASYRENTLLAAQTPTGQTSSQSGGTCSTSGAYNYRYEGLYVLEDGRNYKLFDYTDILRGGEEPTIHDLDNDGDDDVLYHIGDTLYFKENRKNTPVSSHISGPPLILNIDDNSMFNGDIYYEAINGLTEVGVSDGSINVEFQKPSRADISKYTFSYNTIIDRYVDSRSDYIPQSVETHIVDAISRDDTVGNSDQNYSILPHRASLVYAGAMRGITLKTPRLQNIADDLATNTEVTLTANRSLYAGDQSFTIRYSFRGQEQEILRVRPYESVVFYAPIEISELRGDAYISLGEIEDIENTDILDYIGKPFLPGSRIIYNGNRSLLDESSHVDIRYSDDTLREIDFRDVSSYELYDLGSDYGQTYKLRLDTPNDFYYGRIQAFGRDVVGTLSRQILLAPQSESDVIAPQIGLGQKIRVPVYQSYDFDLTPYIYEDGGLGGISQVAVDMNLDEDSDGDGDPRNDADTENISVNKTPARITLSFGPYEELFEREISLALTDDNNNTSRRNVVLEVYTPQPSIDAVEDNTIITGKINEVLTDEPIRLYRYRGGVIEKLQGVDGTDTIVTDESGNYRFETSKTSSGLVLEQAGTPIASINEYTGQIDLDSALTSINILASNTDKNTSLYPELQILYAGSPVFRQFVKVPEGEISQTSSFVNIENPGLALRVIDQERYNSFRVPLGASYNPGSVSVYITSDTTKTPVLTVFQDGRVNIDNSRYRLEYRNIGDKFSLVLVQKGTNIEIADLLYTLEASYILR